ncbi:MULTISPECIES: hypothetical protein [Vibrio]|uniref:EamA domain-containing protein n=2 Tax=Vibrio TaxID=662 RepID=A0A2N7NMA0_9VIBR|nr:MULTISPECIES: hypothetical protein [Vibrio]PMP16963.1 hypothetical protein BCS92_07430 [Vibrio tasmaniensis]TKG28684.1 hypothetical protein FC057_21050 [Vibrio tasmaniensis]TKG39504.1 hypothetical protein FC063_15035 [Vibrio tasmaniensis]TKG43388.1 hypothetical protein FC060_19600 [Vibrio tasmaniensis]TKG53241.1 hypothetical protein FC070_06975 [Vibrio tasmaniensis]
MGGILYIAIAISLNVSAQVLLKYCSGRVFPLSISNGFLYGVLLALFFYGGSFLITLKIYSMYPLSIVSPVMAGLTILCITLSGVFIFSEYLSGLQISGVVLTIFGIVLLSIK